MPTRTRAGGIDPGTVTACIRDSRCYVLPPQFQPTPMHAASIVRLGSSGPKAMASQDGPDFICIGMPKAGTSWLFDQLQYHPDFWMPPIKELQYLNHRMPRLQNVQKQIDISERRRRRRGSRRVRSKMRRGDNRDELFLRQAAKLSGRPMDIDGYAELFRFKGELKSGDISPPYAGLRDEVVAQVGQRLPQVRILLLVRDPLDRTWSNLSMSYRRGNFDPALLEEPKRFRAFFEQQKLDDRLFPTKIAERWSRCAPDLAFRFYLFDDIAAEPERVRGDIISYLGGDPAKPSGDIPAGFNRKANAAKLSLTPPIEAILMEHFEDELRACAELFGGRAKNWLGRHAK